MGFLQDFTGAFVPSWGQGFSLGVNGYYKDRDLDMDLERLRLMQDQWKTQKPMYEADTVLKQTQAQELQAALEMARQIMPMLGSVGSAPTPPAMVPAPGPDAPQAPVWQRNNNPGNIRIPGQNAFQVYNSMGDGAAAMSQLLEAYGAKHGINTISGVINRWAPKGDGDNNPTAYAALVARDMGIDTDQVDLSDPMTRAKMMRAMIKVETGKPDAVPWETIQAAAGVNVPPKAPMASGGGVVPTNQPGGTYPSHAPLRQPQAPSQGQGQPPVQPVATPQPQPPVRQGVPGQAVDGSMLIDPRVLPALVRLAGVPGSGGKLAAGIIDAVTKGQQILGFEMPQTKRVNDAVIDIWKQVQAAGIDLSKQQTMKLFEWNNDPNNPLAAFTQVYGRSFDATKDGDWQAMDKLQGALKRPTNVTQVNMGQESREKQDYGAYLVKDWEGIVSSAASARKTLDNIALAKAIMPTDTGKIKPLKTMLGATMMGFGLDPKALGFDDVNSVGKAQAFQAVMANAILNKAGDMKGNLSDRDVRFLEATVAGLAGTPEANRILLAASEVWAKRDVEKMAFWQQYRKERGSFDGADLAWREYIEKQPPVLEQVAKQSGVNMPGAEAQPGASGPDLNQFWRKK